MILRPYQNHTVESVARAWPEFRRVLVVSPTGSGKTICFSHLAKIEWQKTWRTLVLVDQDELVWQALDKLERTTGIKGEPEKAEHHASKTAPVVVATVQSMIRRLDQWPANHFSLVIADEADKSISDSWQTVLKHFDARVCGFTATPNRTDKRNLGQFYECIAAEIKLFDLINDGFVSPIKVQMLPVPIDLSAVRIRNGDFDPDELDAAITPYLDAVARGIAEHALFRKTLVFLPLIKTSHKFVEIARAHGLNAEHIDGTSDDRKEKLKRFADGEFDILANSALLTRGYDDPAIDCVVPLRPTKSVTLYTQIVGRGTRIAEGKRDLLLLDFLYQSTKHNICRPAHLIATDDIEAEIITKATEQAALPGSVVQELDLQELAKVASSQREEALRKRLDEQRRKKSKTITAEEFALLHHSPELADYEPVMAWESSAVSDRQAKYLKRAKIDMATVSGRGHASKILDIVFKSTGPRLASQKAVDLMRRMKHICDQIGIHDLENVTAAQSGRFFAELNARKEQKELV